MKIFDCTTFYNENLMLEVRFNILNDFVDKFVISEAKYSHSGEKKKLNFDINKFKQFKKKIIYLVIDNEPDSLIYKKNESGTMFENDNDKRTNSIKRIAHQRNKLLSGLEDANDEDYIFYSDNDEIPNFQNFDIKKNTNKIIMFKQKLFYYKFNLKLESFEWFGTKGCRKENLLSPQWLRNVKDKKYPFWRPDIFFSKTKYKDIHFITNGGWHFSYMKTARDIEKKLKSYLHHREYDLDPIGEEKINKMINNKKPVYDLKTDMKNSKFKGGQELVVSRTDELPNYIKKNLNKYKQWLIEV